MDANIFDEYLEYKTKTIFNYAFILTKIIGIDKNKFWHRKKEAEESLKWIIKDYIKTIFDNRNNQNTIKLFIEDKNILKYKIDNELFSVINYFININKAFEIKNYEKEIVLTAVIIHIANALDISSSPYKNNKNNYRTILNNYLIEFNKIPYFKLIDNSKKNTLNLLNSIKEGVKEERKIFETLNSKTSFNKYLKITKNNEYYLAQYNYSVPGLSKIDAKHIKYIFDKEKVASSFTLISADIIVITLMKLFSVRKINKVFFLPVKKEFFESSSNVERLSNILKNNYLNKHLKLVIDYNEYDKNIKRILDDNSIHYYIYCDEVLNLSKKASNYLFSREFAKNNHNLIKDLETKSEIIIEDNLDIHCDDNLLEEGHL